MAIYFVGFFFVSERREALFINRILSKFSHGFIIEFRLKFQVIVKINFFAWSTVQSNSVWWEKFWKPKSKSQAGLPFDDSWTAHGRSEWL